jgi:hypothetical protein
MDGHSPVHCLRPSPSTRGQMPIVRHTMRHPSAIKQLTCPDCADAPSSSRPSSRELPRCSRFRSRCDRADETAPARASPAIKRNIGMLYEQERRPSWPRRAKPQERLAKQRHVRSRPILPAATASASCFYVSRTLSGPVSPRLARLLPLAAASLPRIERMRQRRRNSMGMISGSCFLILSLRIPFYLARRSPAS